MATQTTHYNLTKPDPTDLVDVSVLNDNADIIDQKIFEASQSGGGGTSDYTQLSNKPQINGNTLTGNKTGADLGLVNAVTGKQLSTEDYTTAEKTKLAGIEAQANKTVIDDTLTNTGEAADAKAVGDEISDVRNTLNHLEDGLAIIVNGDTCSTAVPVGGYAYIKNNTHGLAEGLYTNTSASAFPTSGGTANSSVFTAVSGGGLNALNGTNVFIGEPITSPGIDLSTVGINYISWNDLKSPAQVSGFSFVMWLLYGNTYRFAPLGYGGDRIVYYVSTTYNVNGNIWAYPLYKRI